MTEIDQELFLERPGGVSMHIFVDRRGEVSVSLMHDPEPGKPMSTWGLIAVSAAPADCLVDLGESPALLVGAAMFALFAEQAREVGAWLQAVPALIERQRSLPSNVLQLVAKKP